MKARWTILALTAVVLGVCYASTLRGMVDQWTNDQDMGHGFVVPFVVLWLIWRERKRWQPLPSKPSWWGVPILALAAGMHFASALGAGLFVSSVAFLVSIAGAVVCFGGFGLLRAWVFPLLLALFMVPKLAIFYNQVTMPLQLLASRMAASILTLTGFGVIREGNVLDVGGNRIAVAEACDGIRYLLPLGFVGALFGYLSDPRPWMRVALLIAAIPVAIVANAVRVAASGAVPKLAEGTPHEIIGWVIFMLCLATLFFARWCFQAVQSRSHA